VVCPSDIFNTWGAAHTVTNTECVPLAVEKQAAPPVVIYVSEVQFITYGRGTLWVGSKPPLLWCAFL
jgi:mannose-6-phosphate isomerase-like protein (cupin superfamily)